MTPQLNRRAIVFMAGIATLLILGLYGDALATGPLVVWGYVEGATPMPIENHHFGGVGGSIGLEYCLLDYVSLNAGAGYIKVGENRNFIHTDHIRDAYINVYDLRTDLGAKVFIISGPVQPYFGLSLSHHDFYYKMYHVLLDGSVRKMTYPGGPRDFGFAPLMGIKAKIKGCLLIDTLVAFNIATGYEYFTFKAGLGYSFR